MNVLILDDSLMIRERLKENIEQIPRVYQIIEANNLESARKAVDTYDIDVAIVDIKLSGENGIDFIAYVKKFFPSITTIVLTNYPQKQFKIKSYTYGTDYFFDKSSQFNEVFEVIANLKY